MTADLVCPATFTKPSFPSFSEKKIDFLPKEKVSYVCPPISHRPKKESTFFK